MRQRVVWVAPHSCHTGFPGVLFGHAWLHQLPSPGEGQPALSSQASAHSKGKGNPKNHDFRGSKKNWTNLRI